LPTHTGPVWKYDELQIACGWEVKVSRSTGQHFCVHLDSGERALEAPLQEHAASSARRPPARGVARAGGEGPRTVAKCWRPWRSL